jgi:CheY-like chemotaxis protein
MQRAASLLGGEAALAVHLGVSLLQLASWLDGSQKMPAELFLSAIDVICERGDITALGDIANAPEVSSPSKEPSRANNLRKPLRVLVVDDHLDTAQSMAMLIRELGHEAEYAINGYAALTIAERFRPDALLVDLMLPDFDGADLSRLVRKKLAPQPLRVIAITGKGSELARRRAADAGCDKFCLKPLDPHILENLLESRDG